MSRDDVLEELLGEFFALAGAESPETFIARNPEHAELLREHFALDGLIEHALEPRTVLPERVGPFRIEAELGTGGMGTVYRAVVDQPERGFTAGDTVALKVVHPHLFRQRGFFKRFLREAELGRRIDHVNVVRTLDVDAVESGDRPQHYLVMEYVEGQTLRGLMDDLDRVPEELARHIGCEVAKALIAIHEAGAVHRDLKPENVLITPDQVVKVMDLGVAHLADEQMRLSQTGAFVGSLQYAAPEQFSAKSEVDARADLHALGLVLYEMATGTHPYADEDAGTAMRRILTEAPRKAGEINPQLSPFFEEVLARLLEKEPAARFASAEVLLGILEEAEQSSWWHGRAKEIRATSHQPLRRIRVPRETAVYGRDEDIAKLHALYESAKAGDGRVLLIEGEAGIGKTRLVDEFVSRLRQEGEDINFVFASYPPGGAATASGAFSTAYREHFGGEDLEETLKSYLKPTPVLVPAFAALLRGEPTPAGAEALTKDSLQTVFVHATRSIAAERTTIVLIDDLHFAPDDGRALFSSLSMAVPGHRILLLGTMRPGVSEEWIANVTRVDQAGQASLSRLGPKDLSNLLQDAFRSKRLAEELAFRISQKSDGNPFFAFEIIRGLREGQFITQRPDGSWHTTQLIEDIQVPSSILDLVNARVSGLSEDERNMLDVAACWGYEFDPLLVGEVLGVGRIPALRVLAQIERAHRLVRSAGRSYVFDHHQVQEALYGSLSEPLREEYHAALADALEAQLGAGDKDPADLAGAVCVDLCGHFLKGAQGQRALRYTDAALSHLEAGYMNDQAIALADDALESPHLLEGQHRLQVLLQRDRLLSLCGRSQAQEAGLAEAHDIAASLGDRAALANVEKARGNWGRYVGRLQEASSHYEQFLALSREIGDRRAEATAMVNSASLHVIQGHPEAAEQLLESALAVGHSTGDQHVEALAAAGLGGICSNRGRLEECQEHYSQALSGLRATGDRSNEGRVLTGLSELALAGERYEEAMEHAQHALSVARAIGDRQGEIGGLAAVGRACQRRGRLGEALEYYERWRITACEVGDPTIEVAALGNLGSIWLQFGELGRSREALADSLAKSRTLCAVSMEASALGMLAEVASEELDELAALELFQQAVERWRKLDARENLMAVLMRMAESHWRQGQVEEARRALLEASDLARAQRNPGSLCHALALLACLPGGNAAGLEEALQLVADGGRPDHNIRYRLWKATGDRDHLKEAKCRLDRLVGQTPEEYRESMLQNVRVNREIMEAWAEHGENAAE